MTKDDHFSLSAVLKYRKSIEEEAAKDLAELRSRLEEEKLKLKQLEVRKKEAIDKYRENKELTVEEIDLFQSFFIAIGAELDKQKGRVSVLVVNYEKKREELISAAMDKKVMENLRDKEWAEYKRWMLGLEQKNLDEIAINSYGRNE